MKGIDPRIQVNASDIRARTTAERAEISSMNLYGKKPFKETQVYISHLPSYSVTHLDCDTLSGQ
jgi:hypothetical protein